MRTLIIAFDLGSHFACAHNMMRTGIMTENGAYENLPRAHRQGRFLKYCTNRFKELKSIGCKPDVVIYECPFARGLHATRSLWGMAAILEAAATNAGYPVLDVMPTTIKKFATGSGKASKQDMIAAARRFGYTGDNEHEADAVCLLKYAEANVEKS